MSELFLITAREGSKGIINKNIKLLCGKPLLYYSIDIAKQYSDNDHICVSTDSNKIKQVVEDYGLEVPFLRPKILAEDNSSSFDVIRHAIQYYEAIGRKFSKIILLQPTSPLRKYIHIHEAIREYEKNNLDALYSVKLAEATPSYLLYNEVGGLLKQCQDSSEFQRQEGRAVFQVNGSIYIFNPAVFEKYNSFHEIENVGKYLMPKEYSIDIDDMFDWRVCEMLIKNDVLS
jgi:CMP-N,N'-diacetyllegionaminic acid synthase